MINKASIRTKYKHVSIFFVIFYMIGAIGLIVPFSYPLFVKLTFWALLLSNVGLFIFHESYRPKQEFLFFAGLFLTGFIIEAVGVNTGIIFGEYHYGDALGLILFNTPLLIGLNWLFLSYSSVSISESLFAETKLQLLISPTILLIFDVVLEQLAPQMNMWNWANSSVPVKNYIAWWVIGFVFTGMFKLFKINTHNPLALVLFLSQFLFFTVLFIAYNIFI